MTTRATLARLGVLMAAVFVDMMGFLMVLPLLPFYAERMGATPVLIGVLIAAFAFGQMATAPLWGRISDRYGRRPVILAGLSASAFAYLLFGAATTLGVLMLSRLVQGAGGGINGVIQAYVSDTVPADDRAKALGWLTAAASAGVMVGPVLGSLAASIAPAAPGLIAASFCFVNVLFAAWLLPESVVARAEGEGRQPMREAFVAIFRNPGAPAHTMIWIYAMGMMAFMAMNGVLALYLERRFGVTETTIGYFYLYVGAISLLMRAVVLGALVERLGEIGVLRVGVLALATGQLLLPVPTGLVGLALAIALVPIGTSMLFPLTTSQVSRHARPGQVGQTLGLQQSVGGAARMIGPVWAGAVFEHIGWGWPFTFASILVFGAAFVAFVFVRESAVESGSAAAAETVASRLDRGTPSLGSIEGSPSGSSS